jgi:IS1 family transposase
MLPPYETIGDLFKDEPKCLEFLRTKGVFYRIFECASCGGRMRVVGLREILRCAKCRREMSMRAHTFFHGSVLSCSEILRLGYLWLLSLKHGQIVEFTGHARNTVTAFMRHFRSLVSSTLDSESCMIGGPGIVVEMDETKMGKRKYHKGHRVEGVWVVGGVEKTPARRVFLVVVEDRSMKTMQEIVSKNIASGSTIRTDMWKSYGFLDKDPAFIHEVVNHSECLKDPITGVNTNTIEGTWSGLKRKIDARYRVKKGMEGHLVEFIWRRKHAGNLWESFLGAMRDIHYDLD